MERSRLARAHGTVTRLVACATFVAGLLLAGCAEDRGATSISTGSLSFAVDVPGDWRLVAAGDRQEFHRDSLVISARDAGPLPSPGALQGDAFVHAWYAANHDTAQVALAGWSKRGIGPSAWWLARVWDRDTHERARFFACRDIEGRVLVLVQEQPGGHEGDLAFMRLVDSIRPVRR